MKKAVEIVRKAFPNVETHCFAGMGHGELIGNEELFIEEMESFLERNGIIKGHGR